MTSWPPTSNIRQEGIMIYDVADKTSLHHEIRDFSMDMEILFRRTQTSQAMSWLSLQSLRMLFVIWSDVTCHSVTARGDNTSIHTPSPFQVLIDGQKRLEEMINEILQSKWLKNGIILTCLTAPCDTLYAFSNSLVLVISVTTKSWL